MRRTTNPPVPERPACPEPPEFPARRSIDETHQEMLELRDALRARGYDVRIALGAFDLYQNGIWHYLSIGEVRALHTTSLDHPVTLRDHGENRGLNWWYTFPQPAPGAAVNLQEPSR